MEQLFMQIPGYINWDKVIPLNKGWSSDKKYYIETKENEKLLLRIAGIKKYKAKENEFKVLQGLNNLDINSSMPIEFGVSTNNEYVYTIFSWVNGDDAEETLKELPLKKQYKLGCEAGEMLAKIHRNLQIKEDIDWYERYSKKLDKKIKTYNDCAVQFEGSANVLSFIEKNRSLLKDRPIVAHHGDYHIGNMLINCNGELGVIDFDRFDVGDPWEEFNRITWCADSSNHFATGRIDGYFNKNVPENFFKLLALYIGANQLSSIPWAIKFGEKQIDVMQEQAKRTLNNYENYNIHIPKWYMHELKENM